MKVERFVELLNVEFFTGVPDSQLKPLCDYLMNRFGISSHHIIAANEGNCTALAAGYHLATNMIPVVYMQNSGIGNIINPVASLLNDKVYAIPCIFVVGWRGEPGIHDEPQHVFQGEITEKLLQDMDIDAYIVGKETVEEDIAAKMQEYGELLKAGKSVAFIIRKGALSYDGQVNYHNENLMLREEIIRHIVDVADKDVIISTTGKASRELFEIREEKGQKHQYDFLTVGSMGHSSSIALSVALNKPDKKIWCVDGDGAALMHMGAMAVIGNNHPSNMVHIIINNGAHETVGGMPTVAAGIDFVNIAKACGYPGAISVDSFNALDMVLDRAKNRDGLMLIEIKCSIGARDNLGRPTIAAVKNKRDFMEFLSGK